MRNAVTRSGQGLACRVCASRPRAASWDLVCMQEHVEVFSVAKTTFAVCRACGAAQKVFALERRASGGSVKFHGRLVCL